MKKTLAALLALMLLAALPSAVLAESTATPDLIVSARVVAKTEEALHAPASGELAPFTLRAGDAVQSGDTLFTIKPESVYADISGTIGAIYAGAGDIADAAVTRYGSVLTIEYENRHEIQANVSSGHKTVENRDLTAGMPVYLRSANGKNLADGRITSVDGRTFVVEIIGGDLVFTHEIKIYRDPSYDSDFLLGRASIRSVAPYAVSGSGTILSMNVKPGDEVSAGDLLFTYVPDVLDPDLRGKADATAITASQDAVIASIDVTQGASVQKGQAIGTIYPARQYQLKAQVEEGDITALTVGDTLSAVFEELSLEPISVTLASIAPLGTDEDISRYSVYFDFEVPEGVMLGMHATVQP